MAMAASEIEALIKAAIPDARVTVEDLAGDGDHYAATVVSEQFRGITRVKQHQIVYAALRPNGGRAARPRVANLSPRLGAFPHGQRRVRTHPGRNRRSPGDALHEGQRDVPA